MHVHVCVILGRERPARRNTRVATLAHDSYVTGETLVIFFSFAWRRQRLPTMGAVRFHVEALKKHPMSCSMCEPTDTAQSLGDDAHVAVKRPKSASEHGLHTKCVCVFFTVGSESSPLIGVQTRTRANMNVRPRHLVYDEAKSR